MSYKFQVAQAEDDDRKTVTVYLQEEGRFLTADDQHPNFLDIVTSLMNGVDDETLKDQFDATIAIGTKFERVSSRVTTAAGRIFFDGDEVHDSLAEQVLRFMREGAPFRSLVNFWEKIATNPDPHSRDSLYNWLQAQGDFTITDDGDLIAYKGLNHNLTSVHAGPAVVDGVAMNGHVPHAVGSVIQMARSSVHNDPSVGCSVGLHAGTWGYASSFGDQGTTAKVQINPRDVVSVPTDCGAQKMRVCEYKVLELVQGPEPRAWTGDWNDEYDGDPGDYDLDDDLDDIESELDENQDSEGTVEVPTGALRQVLASLRDAIRNKS